MQLSSVQGVQVQPTGGSESTEMGRQFYMDAH